uniref:uncharacterized protein LOC122608477 n=1 Tax=Erigeron canadensis TaxID=72917 RepID=UPI001CB99761|nr:uncharacterized protein LOC122608477 [Erigeron canadensis]
MKRKRTPAKTTLGNPSHAVVAEPETSRRFVSPRMETSTGTGIRGRQADLETGENYPDVLGKMISTIIREISKESGGIGNLSRSIAANSVTNVNQIRPHRTPELNAALEVIKKTMKLDAAGPFNQPVDPVALGIPDYFDVIKIPMDFGTICYNLENGLKYMNATEVFQDVQYIWNNCLIYNKKGNHILELMKRVQTLFTKYWKASGLDNKQSATIAESSILKHNKRKTDNPSTPIASNFLHSQPKDAGSHQVAEKRTGPVNTQSGPPQQSSSLSESSPEKDEDSTYTEKKHEVQRPTHYHNLSSTMERIKVFTNEKGQPVGPEAFQLTKFLGHIARDGNLAPLSFSGWSKMPEVMKENLWQKVLTRFDIDPCSRSWVLMSLESKWKSFRSLLKTTRYDTHATDEERLADRDERVLPEQWSVLVSHWSSDKFQNISAKNKANRAKVRFYHTLGAKSYARKIEEERAKRPNGQELSPEEVFILTRTCKNGQAVNEATNAVISQLRESATQDKAYFRGMGEDREGGVSLSGLNATPKSEIFTRAEALRMAKEKNEEIDAIKDRLASLEQTCSGMATQMSAMMSMMATMLKGSHGESSPNAVVPTLLPEAGPNQPEPASKSNHEFLGRQTRGSKNRR